MFSAALVSLAVSLAVSAAPASDITTRATSYCGQWDQVTVGTYTLFLDQWGLSGASSGSDCATIDSQSGNTVAWTDDWTAVGVNAF
ncbi:unnamed protein product [Peniophora sp. CBMAI 1063]|nr:unnamed protein product [Peniophora sp. CBMAI 1063]